MRNTRLLAFLGSLFALSACDDTVDEGEATAVDASTTLPGHACCHPDGICSNETSEAACEVLAGTYTASARCDEVGCGQPEQYACCHDGGCTNVVAESACSALGGTFDTNGTCSEVGCPSGPSGGAC